MKFVTLLLDDLASLKHPKNSEMTSTGKFLSRLSVAIVLETVNLICDIASC